MAQTLRPPQHLQPQLKAPSTVSGTSPSDSSTSAPKPFSATVPSRSSSPSQQLRARKASEKAISPLIRRVLCPNAYTSAGEARPLHEVLPPLTSSNDVDLQLYAIIAIVVKDTVQSWYNKITTDQIFVEEVVAIIAHCTRAIEGRLRSVNVQALILDGIPKIVECHCSGEEVLVT